MVEAIRKALNGHAKLVYLIVTGLAGFASLGFVLKLGVDDWFTRVTRAAVLAPQHADWIEDHDAWSKQRNAEIGDGISQLTTEAAVLKARVEDNKEISEKGFDNVLGVLIDTRNEIRVMNQRLFDIQGRLRAGTEAKPIGEADGVGAQR